MYSAQLDNSWVLNPHLRILPIPRHFLLDLNLCISNGTASTKVYDKRDDFDFDIVNFLFLDGDVPGVPHMWYTYVNLLDSPQLLQILMTLTAVRQGYRYFKLRKAFSKFYRRHSALVEKYSVNLKTLLRQGISEPEFYGDLMYRFRKKCRKI